MVAVKVDDAIPYADPQSGLDQADVVYDEPVEGGLDWFLALFQCSIPTRVGPVRDADPVDPGILSQYGSALLASDGGAAAVLQAVGSTPGLVDANSTTYSGAYSRDSTRQEPYNLYVDPQTLLTEAKNAAQAAAVPPFTYSGAARTGSVKASAVTFQLGPTVSYAYDTSTNAYQRSENSQPQLAEGGTQISVTNVIIMWTQVNQTQITDSAGNPTPDPAVVGQGNAMVLTGGREYDGTWSRATNAALTTFVTTAGAAIPLTPGNTWINILPTDEPAFVT